MSQSLLSCCQSLPSNSTPTIVDNTTQLEANKNLIRQFVEVVQNPGATHLNKARVIKDFE